VHSTGNVGISLVSLATLTWHRGAVIDCGQRMPGVVGVAGKSCRSSDRHVDRAEKTRVPVLSTTSSSSDRHRQPRQGGAWNQSWTQPHDTVATAETDNPANDQVGHQRRHSRRGRPASGGGSAGSNPAGGATSDLPIPL